MSNSKMQLAAVIYGKDDLRMEERPVPLPGKGEVQIAVACVGICGSDIHYLQEGSLGTLAIKEPFVLGHEFSGTVTSIGEGVTSLKIGDRVTPEPAAACRKCEICLSGRYNICRNRVTFCGTPGFDGALRALCCHPANFCHRLPDSLSMEEGMLMNILAVGVYVCERACIRPGSSIIVTGAGPVGIAMLLAAKASGATKVCITDVLQHRLDFAKSVGATHTLLVKASDDPQAAATKVKDLMGCEAETSIECSGAEEALSMAILATKPGKVVAVVGTGNTNKTIPAFHALTNEIDIYFCFAYKNCHEIAMELVTSGKVDIKPLITHRFKLDKALEAFDCARNRQGMKVAIACNDY
ncbi:sorbitol dehydrogenase [Lingula anatina]|uniref:Sorbitol dehydrogenase n=1 Tax=Lingula anatina TaxID=7574 RepID=A0A1S3HLQ5_LINAN|nr:sorbitol dehydrogenase [Lingula anatina]XP_013386947.1 sorbitol dehydrogenase [Lingula anatina]XP_013386955.1 sorbitol dehydrogenase [Lingula anatina]|eukprot:XP_013386940.1 sorbitol dehydrogenase [Lingula anatina]